MKQHKLSAGKRFAKPVLFGSVLIGLAAVFINRHKFFEDVDVIRAQERVCNESKRMEVLERRQKQIEELAKKKKQGGT